MKFKACGLRILESKEGHYLLTHSNLNADLLIRKQELDEAILSMPKAYELLKKITDYLTKVESLRWAKIKSDLIKIAQTDKAFVQHRKALIREGTLNSLKKLERDIYFYNIDKNAIQELNKLKKGK